MSDEVKIPLPQSLQEIVGALLFASETPLTATDLREAVRAVEAEEGENREVMDVYRTCTAKEVAEALRGLEKALEVAGCGFRLVCAGGAYRLQSVPSCGRYVRAMLKMDRPSRLGRASLETLAIIAYRQPLTKSEIEAIRGVDVSGNVKTLMDLQLIRLVGKSELPGHPFLYGTTPLFLEHFGLASLQQLNELDPTLQRSNPKQKAASYRKKVEVEAEGGEKVEVEAEGGEGKVDDPLSTSTSSLVPEEKVEVEAEGGEGKVGDSLSTSTSSLDLPNEPVVLAEAIDDDDDGAADGDDLLAGSALSATDDDLLAEDGEDDEFDDEDEEDDEDDDEDDEDEEGDEDDDED